MDRRNFVKSGLAAAYMGAQRKPKEQNYQVGAYYFPNFHVDPRNEEVHGKDWTEWEILKRGEPKFPGHIQPKRPLWGYEDESRPDIFEKKLASAQQAGMNHLIFDWYWYEGKPFLHTALEAGYQRCSTKHDVRFCLMWANHDWYNLMPARLHDRSPPLYRATSDRNDFDRATSYILEHYFSDSSYFLVSGAPYFSIYKLGDLVDRLGGIEQARSAFDGFRRKVRAAGFPDLHLNAIAMGIQGMADLKGTLAALGVRSVTSYTWMHHFDLRRSSFPAVDYADVLESTDAFWKRAADAYGVPYHLDISMGWDPSPRSCQSDRYERGDYPFSPILINNSPANFTKALLKAKAFLESRPDQSRIVAINAWNEWTEGSYLEPDAVNGMKYLEAIRGVFGA